MRKISIESEEVEVKIDGKVALVTGAVSGLGKAAARLIVENGGKVVMMDVSEEAGTAAAAEFGSAAAFVKTDVTSESDVKAAVELAIAKFSHVDIVCNVAGINIPNAIVGKKGPYPLEQWTKIIQINLIGTFNVMRLGAQAMLGNEPDEDGERGVIVNTSSVAAFHGEPGQTAYSSSKGGINSLCLPAARELSKYGIRCFAIAPGLFATPIYDTLPESVMENLKAKTVFPKRFGKPEEFAKAVQAVIENPMFNGDVLRLDGAVRF